MKHYLILSWIVLFFTIAFIVAFFSISFINPFMYDVFIYIEVVIVLLSCPISLIDFKIASNIGEEKIKEGYEQKLEDKSAEIEIRRAEIELERDRIRLEREKLRATNSEKDDDVTIFFNCNYCRRELNSNINICPYCGREVKDIL